MKNPIVRLFEPQHLLRKIKPEGELPDGRQVLRRTMQMAWPSMLESFLVSLVGVIDTIMVSGLGSYAIAAVGLTNQPKFIGLAIFLSLKICIRDSGIPVHRVIDASISHAVVMHTADNAFKRFYIFGCVAI